MPDPLNADAAPSMEDTPMPPMPPIDTDHDHDQDTDQGMDTDLDTDTGTGTEAEAAPETAVELDAGVGDDDGHNGDDGNAAVQLYLGEKMYKSVFQVQARPCLASLCFVLRSSVWSVVCARCVAVAPPPL